MRLEGRSLRRPERETPCAEGAAQPTGSSEELRSLGPSELPVVDELGGEVEVGALHQRDDLLQVVA